MTAVELSADDRAAAGAAWLDDVYPEWWQVVDLDLLDMGSGCTCVAGQTCGTGNEDDDTTCGFDALMDLAEMAGEDSPAWVMERGFLLAGSDPSWQPLDAAWRRIIETRRSLAAIDNEPSR